MNDSLGWLSEPECDRAAARLSEPSLTAFDLLKTKTEMKNSPLFFIFYQVPSAQIIKNLYIVPDN